MAEMRRDASRWSADDEGKVRLTSDFAGVQHEGNTEHTAAAASVGVSFSTALEISGQRKSTCTVPGISIM
jgi:hypothetical protein